MGVAHMSLKEGYEFRRFSNFPVREVSSQPELIHRFTYSILCQRCWTMPMFHIPKVSGVSHWQRFRASQYGPCWRRQTKQYSKTVHLVGRPMEWTLCAGGIGKYFAFLSPLATVSGSSTTCAQTPVKPRIWQLVSQIVW